MPLLRIADLDTAPPSLFELAQELSTDFEKWEGQDEHDRPPGIHASEISGCPRRAVYTMIDTQKMEKPDPMWRKKFKHGQWVHSGLQRDMHQWARSLGGKLKFQDEVPINPYNSHVAREFEIFSSCDGIFIIRVPDQNGKLVDAVRVGLEIKTASPAEYEKITEPKEAHIEQVHTYMACLDVPCFWIMYYNKGNENTTPSRGRFFVRFQHAIWDRLAERFNRWHELVEQTVLPDREEGIGCEWCPYRWTCNPQNVRSRQPRTLQSTSITTRKHWARKE